MTNEEIAKVKSELDMLHNMGWEARRAPIQDIDGLKLHISEKIKELNTQLANWYKENKDNPKYRSVEECIDITYTMNEMITVVTTKITNRITNDLGIKAELLRFLELLVELQKINVSK